jgi:hypothetical protein
MSTYLTRTIFIALIISLCSCATVKGPDAIISKNGAKDAAKDIKEQVGQVGLFVESWKHAHTAAMNANAESASLNVTAESMAKKISAEAAAALRMRRIGFEYVQQNCRDFFATAGENQKWLYFSRDAVGALGTLATTIISMRGGSKAAVETAALITGIGYTGIDVYTKNFLFSAENISSVEEMIVRALEVNEDDILKRSVPISYGDAAISIMDHQTICSPIKIASLVKEAIKKAEIIPVATNSGLTTLESIQDANARQKLSAALALSRPVSIKQAAMFYWLFDRADSTLTENAGVIRVLLSDLPEASIPVVAEANNTSTPPVRAGDIVQDWPLKAAVISSLNEFSKSSRDKFDAIILEAQAAALAAAQVTPNATGVQSTPASLLQLPIKSALRKSPRSTVGVK